MKGGGDALTLAVIQCPLGEADPAVNRARVFDLIRGAAGEGAQVICPPELFDGPYFCKTQDEGYFETAYPWAEHPSVVAGIKLAAELNIAFPVSIFERDGPHYYNTIVMLDGARGVLGLYRKSHIPDGPGYQEKFYFRPGDTGFRVWDTQFGKIGVGICWDQWFPEAARAMALQGAEALLYPTAIGTEPQDPKLDTSGAWQRVMQGHAAANALPIVAANRVGVEDGQRFYGQSFIARPGGAVAMHLDDSETGFVLAEFDRKLMARERAAWGFFRDRRPDLYGGG